MERNFKNEDFEQFLKQSADGLRMRPSERVWKEISRNLNQRRRRFGYFLGITLLVTSALGYYLLEPSSNDKLSNRNTATNAVSKNSANPGIKNEKQLGGTYQVQDNLVPSPSKPVQIPLAQQRSTGNVGINDLITGMIAEPIVSLQNEGGVVVNDQQNEFEPTVIDSDPGYETSAEPVRKTELKQDITYPMTAESVTNSYSPRLRKGKMGLQLFFTPTVSYRYLRENKMYTNGPLVGMHSLKSAVNHKPDFGFQLGVLARYPVSNKVKLRGGFQFNVNRYDIKTKNGTYEIGTIRFNNRETVNTVTSYNNFSGYKIDWLENLYLQVSAPLGAELRLKGNEKTNFGVAASIQPTYLISDKSYLISTDYKNYMEVPWLVRKWNVNTGVEAFVSYSTGQMKWQVGPQVRYQLLSSYEDKYPVKEHLFDFGLRVGVSLNNR